MFDLALKSDREVLNLIQKRRPKETYDNVYGEGEVTKRSTATFSCCVI